MHAHIDAHGHITSHRRDSLTDMNPSTTRGRTLSDVAQHWPQCTAVTQCSKSRAVATEKAATAPHRVRTAVLRQHSGHSRAMSAATIGQPRRPVACSGRAQRWGRGYGRLERYTNVFRVPEHVQRKIGTYPVHLGLDHGASRASRQAERRGTLGRPLAPPGAIMAAGHASRLGTCP